MARFRIVGKQSREVRSLLVLHAKCRPIHRLLAVVLPLFLTRRSRTFVALTCSPHAPREVSGASQKRGVSGGFRFPHAEREGYKLGRRPTIRARLGMNLRHGFGPRSESSARIAPPHKPFHQLRQQADRQPTLMKRERERHGAPYE